MTVSAASAEWCLKCNICTAACPVAAVTDEFLGPKAVGPQAERFRHPSLAQPDPTVSWCSGCGACSRVCPHGVPVAELNLLAKARLTSQKGSSLRDQAIARPASLARLARPLAPVANALMGSPSLRRVAEAVLGVSRFAPLPRFASRSFRSLEASRRVASPPASASRPRLAYFHGCSVDAYEPHFGQLTLHVLEALGFDVVVPPQGCCGLPLQSNGLLDEARRYALRNVEALTPFAAADIPIVGTSTSCTLALKHEYRAVLGLEGESPAIVAAAVTDIFELIRSRETELLEGRQLHPVPLRILYHPPCQLKSHAVGFPAYDVLRRIPDLEITLSDAECCGVAGTYGMKRERYTVARAVGASLFEAVRRIAPDAVVTDSETCRWWLEGHTGVRSCHPLELLALALGVAGTTITVGGKD